MALKRVLSWLLWYLSIGLAVAIEVGSHQAARIDPGFDPLITAIATVFIWPIPLALDLFFFVAHLSGGLPRH